MTTHKPPPSPVKHKPVPSEKKRSTQRMEIAAIDSDASTAKVEESRSDQASNTDRTVTIPQEPENQKPQETENPDADGVGRYKF